MPRPSNSQSTGCPDNGGDVGEAELQKLIQQLYMAQAQVQLEANEIQKAQSVAATSQQHLEEAANNVRIMTAALHAAQEAVAGAAIRAQTAQLQVAAHDQLLFAARQKVDALSGQMVGLQAKVGLTQNKFSIDMPGLLNKLKEPLKECERPKPIPPLVPTAFDNPGGGMGGGMGEAPRFMKSVPEAPAQVSSPAQTEDAVKAQAAQPQNQQQTQTQVQEQPQALQMVQGRQKRHYHNSKLRKKRRKTDLFRNRNKYTKRKQRRILDLKRNRRGEDTSATSIKRIKKKAHETSNRHRSDNSEDNEADENYIQQFLNDVRTADSFKIE